MCICCVQSVDPGKFMDCPAQTVDPRFAWTICGLSHAQRDQLSTYSKPQRLPNPKNELLTSPYVADRCPSPRLCPVSLVCAGQSMDCPDPWFAHVHVHAHFISASVK